MGPKYAELKKAFDFVASLYMVSVEVDFENSFDTDYVDELNRLTKEMIKTGFFN